MGSAADHHFRDQQDLVRWIENKLGSNELWGGKQASFILTREILVELETCFQELEPHIKLKIIQAMVHLSPKTIYSWKEPLFNLLDVARRDPDDWVETVADIFRNFPDAGLIQCSSKVDSYFNRTQQELEKIVTGKFSSFGNKLPLKVPSDSELLPPNLLKNSSTNDEAEIKHFTRKQISTKSAKMLEDVKKSSEQQSNPSSKKNHGLISSFPIKIRSTAKRLDNALPMRGIPSTASALKMSGGFTNESKKYQQRTLLKRTGEAMLLDIDELPKQNRRRRNAETAAADKKKVVASLVDTQKVTTSSPAKNSEEMNENDDIVAQKHDSELLKPESNATMPPVHSSAASECIASEPVCVSFLETQQLPAQQMHSKEKANNNNSLNISSSSSAFQKIESLPHQTQQQIDNDQLLGTSYNNNTNNDGIFAAPTSTSMESPVMTDIPNSNLMALQQFEGILKDANKLTPIGYNLIISFLAGNKHNPFQEKFGSVMTLPFSETIEFEPCTGGVGMEALLVETFFQMDYRTREWRRLKKSRTLKPEELNQRKDQLFGSGVKKMEQQFIIGGQTQQPQNVMMMNGQGTSSQMHYSDVPPAD